MTSTQLHTKGFTLVELLIVIALLGALVIGLLTALDPIEQIRRGRDAGIRNTASEFFNANIRYYTNKYQFPWGTSGIAATNAYAMGSDITALINAGELKANFYDRAGSSTLSKMLVNSTSATDFSVCMRPDSKSIQRDPATVFGSDGLTSATTCKSQTSGTGGIDCYICFR
jgi:prepilin-type N-terminal cleavage/methylation domain-containing protein